MERACHIPSFWQSIICTYDPRLTDDQLVLLGELVHGNLQVQRGGPLPYASGDIVVRTVAGAEPTAKVTSLADGHTS